jgi:hypothetical protein
MDLEYAGKLTLKCLMEMNSQKLSEAQGDEISTEQSNNPALKL